MAITIETASPSFLLKQIKDAIASGKIVNWSVDSDGDFTHETAQWQNVAWLRPRIVEGRLKLFILSPKSKRLSKTAYAIYHGRFIETVLAHFDTSVTRLSASALAETGDIIS